MSESLTREEFDVLAKKSFTPLSPEAMAPVGMVPLANVLSSMPRVKRPAAPFWTFGMPGISGATALQYSMGRGHAPACAFGTAQGVVGYFSEDFIGPTKRNAP